MLHHGARTHTICAFTLLSPQRVRKLAKQVRRTDLRGINRQRGPSPTKLANLLASPYLNLEFSAIAGLCQWVGVMPKEPLVHPEKSLPAIERGERLCYTLELFQAIVPYSRVTLEQLILLVTSLAERAEWQLGTCHACSAVILIDLLGAKSTLCVSCERERGKGRGANAGEFEVNPDRLPEADWSEAVQQSLF
jgi:hypothetical protein